MQINFVQRSGIVWGYDIIMITRKTKSMLKKTEKLKEKYNRLMQEGKTAEELVAFTAQWTAGRNIRADCHIIQAMEDTTITQQHLDEKKDQCSVCMENYKLGEEVMKCPNCKNLIHDDCIRGWLAGNETCPLCRHVNVVL